MSEEQDRKAFFKNYNGKLAIRIAVSGPDQKILADVEGQQVAFTLAEWDALPLWQGPVPVGV